MTKRPQRISDLEGKSDEQILALSVTHPSLFALLVRKYEARFMRKAMGIVHDETAAEDIRSGREERRANLSALGYTPVPVCTTSAQVRGALYAQSHGHCT